ncbi:unnamed protein product [Musa acuminata subsp. malaccensis]|uniref:(wild Malaysian banana) hypothetical protein n=1 Tax=Musa acuminata subsp. malaccensis TaxID=214687 RepID=A0A804KRZ7_MUSAM|nr:unnamed protein product [Musa acuminata subsp. malaccensis]
MIIILFPKTLFVGKTSFLERETISPIESQVANIFITIFYKVVRSNQINRSFIFYESLYFYSSG